MTTADDAWALLCFPPGERSVPDFLDVADRLDVFVGVNYHVGPDWIELLKTCPTGITRDAARKAIRESFAGDDEVPQRTFVRRLVHRLSEHFQAVNAAQLKCIEDLATNNAYPPEAGLVAIAIARRNLRVQR